MAAANPGAAAPPVRPYTASPTFYTQIVTSLKTVMSGFLLSALLAIPVGIAIGLSGPLHGAVNPLIQVFKPVSPLAWLPLVTLVVASVGMNDLWIAACALSQNPVLPVASHDHAFEMIAAEFNLPVVRINAA